MASLQSCLPIPLGGRVRITTAIADHIAKGDKLGEQRQRYFPLIPETIEDPAEIWVSFARHEASGKVAIRRRYARRMQIEEGGKNEVSSSSQTKTTASGQG